MSFCFLVFNYWIGFNLNFSCKITLLQYCTFFQIVLIFWDKRRKWSMSEWTKDYVWGKIFSHVLSNQINMAFWYFSRQNYVNSQKNKLSMKIYAYFMSLNFWEKTWTKEGVARKLEIGFFSRKGIESLSQIKIFQS